jgi:hypothetical protein
MYQILEWKQIKALTTVLFSAIVAAIVIVFAAVVIFIIVYSSFPCCGWLFQLQAKRVLLEVAKCQIKPSRQAYLGTVSTTLPPLLLPALIVTTTPFFLKISAAAAHVPAVPGTVHAYVCRYELVLNTRTCGLAKKAALVPKARRSGVAKKGTFFYKKPLYVQCTGKKATLYTRTWYDVARKTFRYRTHVGIV